MRRIERKQYVVSDSHSSESFDLSLEEQGNRCKRAVFGNNIYEVDIKRIQPGHLFLNLDGKNYDILIFANDNKWHVQLNGRPIELTLLEAGSQVLQRIAKSNTTKKKSNDIHAPMPGLVLRVMVRDGESVKPNDGLVVIEAMKMENEIRAEINGTVKKVTVREGQAVDKGTLLMQVE